jgi:hypothetical protein
VKKGAHIDDGDLKAPMHRGGNAMALIIAARQRPFYEEQDIHVARSFLMVLLFIAGLAIARLMAVSISRDS